MSYEKSHNAGHKHSFEYDDSEAAWESSELTRVNEAAEFLNDYRRFDFDAMSELPVALDVFIEHQHNIAI